MSVSCFPNMTSSGINRSVTTLVSVILMLVILLPTNGFEISTTIVTATESEIDNSLLPLCRIVRNARNSLRAKAVELFAHPEVPTDCVISNSCTSLTCSTDFHGKHEYGLNLNFCAPVPTIDFNVESRYVVGSSWKFRVSPRPATQRKEIPQWAKAGANYYLNVTFLRRYSDKHLGDDSRSRLSLDVSVVDTCNATLHGSVNIFNGIQFPLRQICGTSGSIPSNLEKSVPKVQIPGSITSHIGMPCTLDNPFKCGPNSVCHWHEGGRRNEGICACCDACDLDKNGSCVVRKNTSTEDPSHAAHQGDNVNSSVVTGVGAFFSIFALFILGGGIFYGIKYSVFSRLNNRLRFYWTSHCSRRRVISVADQGNMFNPIYDDDDPPLL